MTYIDDYDYDKIVTLPVDSAPSRVDRAISDEERNRLINLLLGDSRSDKTVNAAHMYQRKNEKTYDSFGNDRNRSYGSDCDDVVIQVTIVVPNHSPLYKDVMETVHTPVVDMVAEERKQAAKEKVEQAAAAMDKAVADLEQAKATLAAMEK